MAPLTLAVVLLAAPAPPGGLPALRAFLADWRAGRIDLLQAVPGGYSVVRPDGTAETRYYRREALDRLERLFAQSVEEGGEETARVLLELATTRFDDDPVVEALEHPKRQPWAVRRRALAALAALTDRESRRYLRAIALTDRTAAGVERRRVACLALARCHDVEAAEGLLAACEDRVAAVRAAAVRALGEAPAMFDPDDLLASLSSRADDEDRAVRIEALLALEAAAKAEVPHAPATLRAALRRRIRDEDPAVRRLAARLAERWADRPSLGWLLEALGAEQGESGRRSVRSALRRALVRLTGLDLPSDRPDLWAEALSRAAASLDPWPPDRPIPAEQGPRFFSIPIESDRVLFLVDRSGSMAIPVFSHRERPTRFDLAAAELLRAVADLGPDARVGVALFAEDVETVTDPPCAGGEACAERLRPLLDEIVPDGGTDLFGALVRGLGWLDPLGDSETDQILLLTDGVPSRGALLHPDEIVTFVAEHNRTRRVRIDTIACSGDAAFLRALARANGGTASELKPPR